MWTRRPTHQETVRGGSEGIQLDAAKQHEGKGREETTRKEIILSYHTPIITNITLHHCHADSYLPSPSHTRLTLHSHSAIRHDSVANHDERERQSGSGQGRHHTFNSVWRQRSTMGWIRCVDTQQTSIESSRVAPECFRQGGDKRRRKKRSDKMKGSYTIA